MRELGSKSPVRASGTPFKPVMTVPTMEPPKFVVTVMLPPTRTIPDQNQNELVMLRFPVTMSMPEPKEKSVMLRSPVIRRDSFHRKFSQIVASGW